MIDAVSGYLCGLIDLAALRERTAICHVDLAKLAVPTQRLCLGVDGRLAEHLSGRSTEHEFRRHLVDLLSA